MFEAVNKINETPGLCEGIDDESFTSFTCVVEMKPSKASNYLHETDEVRVLLGKLAETYNSRPRSVSSNSDTLLVQRMENDDTLRRATLG
jgi:hypothetical protein